MSKGTIDLIDNVAAKFADKLSLDISRSYIMKPSFGEKTTCSYLKVQGNC